MEVIQNYREDGESNREVIENYREGTINREVKRTTGKLWRSTGKL